MGCSGWLILTLLKRLFPVGYPKKPYKVLPVPDAPDYNKAESWAAYPGKSSAAETTPEGLPSVPEGERRAACFFVHPTTFFGDEGWNEPFGFKASQMLTESFLHIGASAFNECCRIYAPFYRQASFQAQLFHRESGRLAFELAYSDVKQAFLHFLKKEPTAPILLASHSQGGQHLMRILAECIEPDPALQKRLVAAYMVGTNVLPLDAFTRLFPSLHACEGPTDTPGAVIAWDTKAHGTGAAKPADFGILPEFHGIWYPSGWDIPKKGAAFLNTNPLTWSSTPGTRVTEGWLGTACLELPAKTKPFTKKEFMLGQLTEAQCKPALRQNGHKPEGLEFFAESLPHCLCVPKLKPADCGVFARFTEEGDYHNVDYPIFYYNIRQNVSDRLQAFLSKQ